MSLMRLGAALFAALVISLAIFPGFSPVAAQIQTVPRETGAPPIAAPTGEAEAGTLPAAPVGEVESEFVGPQSQAQLEQTFTPLGLFMRADWVVKSVMILLLLASFWSWVVIVDKWFGFGSLKRRTRKFEKEFWSGRSLDDLYSEYAQKSGQPMAVIFVAALREWKRSYEKGGNISGINSRVELAMSVAIQRESEKIERGLNYLATVGATAPFVGLFGTVWGIMTSFQAIAVRQDTTLAVVAPGIAEALFATALGLLAAIPAVVAYNRFQGETNRFIARLESFADELSAFLSRQVNERVR